MVSIFAYCEVPNDFGFTCLHVDMCWMMGLQGGDNCKWGMVNVGDGNAGVVRKSEVRKFEDVQLQDLT